MKIKLTITGPQVHDTGYRSTSRNWLCGLALRGFEVYNDTENEKQAVIAIAEGDEQRVVKLYDLAVKEHPQPSEVDNIKSEEYAGDVMPLWQFANINSATQMNKAIPILLEMKGDMKEMKVDMKEMKGYMKEMKGDLKEMKGDIKTVKQNTDAIPQVLEEVRGIRDDLQPGFAIQFKQMQKDIESINERLGML